MKNKKLMIAVILTVLIVTVGLAGCVNVTTERYEEASGNSVRLYGRASTNEFYTGNPSSSSDVKFKFSTSRAGCQNCDSYSNSVYVSREDFSEYGSSVSFSAVVSGLNAGERYYFRACALYYPNEPNDPVYIGGNILSFKLNDKNSLEIIEVKDPSIIKIKEILDKI